ncbi:hypothetical protein P7K49_017201 [Saguinus oedipus]|uniref:Uncharacterized protein n=1 Tax=Saguinus oedipus TaxID=9490 RepID=A0ABQ9V2J8_SAGOE|nr:hypothetical protein P7K49_017201 [Saguinus oedipus]
MPNFFSLLDEIVGNLGEGTFGKVVECLDHASHVPPIFGLPAISEMNKHPQGLAASYSN